MFEVMLVEDSPGDAELIQLALAEGQFPCRITVADNGKEAIAMLRRPGTFAGAPRPDLVLLDLNIPQMNGKEVLKEMKRDPELSLIPVVVLTTSDVERDVVASYQLGAAGYLSKPLDVEQLFTAIHRVEEYWFDVVRRPSKQAT